MFWRNLRDSFQEGLARNASFFKELPTSIGGAIGSLAADLISDGTREQVWYWNHPLATSHIIGNDLFKTPGLRQGMEHIGGAIMSLGVVPILSGNVSLANLDEMGRKPGYSAVLPSEEDPTVTTNPVGEFLARYLFGRSGRLLPYAQAKAEIPSLTKEQYDKVRQSIFSKNPQFFGLEENPLIPATIGAGTFATISAIRNRPGGTHWELTPTLKEFLSDDNKETYRKWMPHPNSDDMGDYFKKIGKSALVGGIIGSLVPLATQVGVLKQVETLEHGPAAQIIGYQIPISALPGIALSAGALALGVRLPKIMEAINELHQRST